RRESADMKGARGDGHGLVTRGACLAGPLALGAARAAVVADTQRLLAAVGVAGVAVVVGRRAARDLARSGVARVGGDAVIGARRDRGRLVDAPVAVVIDRVAELGRRGRDGVVVVVAVRAR